MDSGEFRFQRIVHLYYPRPPKLMGVRQLQPLKPCRPRTAGILQRAKRPAVRLLLRKPPVRLHIYRRYGPGTSHIHLQQVLGRVGHQPDVDMR